MDDLSIVLLFFGAIIASSLIIRIFPAAIPAPLIQIAVGFCVTFIGGFGVELEPELFLFLFLPPLLFLDAWQIQKRSFYQNMRSIISLAMGLVVFTVLGLGYVIHIMIPSIPLPAAFALAAILSPTDPVAISAIGRTIPIPHRLMHILEGEALLNDASGLVCMRFAIAALASGTFSLTSASADFIWLVVGGLGIGVFVSYITNYLDGLVTKYLGEDGNAQILLSLLIPFAAYYLADKVQASGVLAAVAAGLFMSKYDILHLSGPTMRLRRNSVWQLLKFGLNSAMFIILGEQLPHIFAKASALASSTGHPHGYWVIIYAAAVTASLIVLRFAWVTASILVSKSRQSFLVLLITSLAGVRGSITLAGVLSIPIVLDTGAQFPARNLIIFIAACVIIMSLLMASCALPPLLRQLDRINSKHGTEPMPIQEWQTRKKAADAALLAIEAIRQSAPENMKDIVDQAASTIVSTYADSQLHASAMINTDQREETEQRLEIERKLWISALQAERQVIQTETRSKRLTDDTARLLLHEVDLREERWSRNPL